MRSFLFFIAISCIFGCNEKDLTKERFYQLTELIKNNQINQADSIFGLLKNNKEIDFNYHLIEIVLVFKMLKFDSSAKLSFNFIKSYPKSAFGFYYLGLSQFNLNVYTKAEEQFSNALEKFGNEYPSNHIYVDREKAEFIFQEESIYNDVIFMLGLSRSFTGKYKTAIYYIESCVNRGYKLGESYLILGDCYLNLGDKSTAKKYYLLALNGKTTQIDPHSPQQTDPSSPRQTDPRRHFKLTP